MTLVQLDPAWVGDRPDRAGTAWGRLSSVEQCRAAGSTSSDSALSDSGLADSGLADSGLADRALSDRALSDAAAGTTAMFAEHSTRMLRVAAVLLSDPAMAEDVVQDAYAALYSSWGRLRDREAAVGYLHRSVVNGARSKLRRRVVALRHTPPPLPDEASAEDTALAGLTGGPLVAALRALPRREREVVLLRHYLDLSERATADALGLRPGSVKAYGSRGLATLRTSLAQQELDR